MKRDLMILVVLVLLLSIPGRLQAQPAAPQVIAQGAPIHGANGVAFDNNDRLYIASVGGREIVVMNPETGQILDRLGVEVGVDSPDDLTFGPDGSLYWTAIMTGEVGRIAPDGTKTGQFVALGVNPVTFSDDGRLFTALDFLGDGFYELDPELVEPPRLIIKELGFLNAFDFGPDGYLYGPIYTQGKLVRIDVDTGEMTTIADGFSVTPAVKFDSQGQLYAGDSATGEIFRVNLDGKKEVIATDLPGLDNLAFDTNDRLFVSGADDGYIVEVLADGTNRVVSAGGMTVPQGVAILPGPDDPLVLVADMMTVRQFNGTTGDAQQVYRSSDDSFSMASTLAVDGENIVLASWFSNLVQVWSPATNKVLETYDDFAVPLNAIRFQGDLVVAELGSGSVVRASAANPAERVTLADNLAVPAGLAARAGNLWAGDWATGTVWQIAANGALLAEPIQVATDLSFPEGLAVTADGNLLVVETGAGRLSAINLETGAISTVAEGLAFGAPAPDGMPPTWGFNGVAVGPTGAIYVTGDKTNVLYRLEGVSTLPETGDEPFALYLLLLTVGGLLLIVGLGMRQQHVSR